MYLIGGCAEKIVASKEAVGMQQQNRYRQGSEQMNKGLRV